MSPKAKQKQVETVALTRTFTHNTKIKKCLNERYFKLVIVEIEGFYTYNTKTLISIVPYAV
jgi:hypothetical protein